MTMVPKITIAQMAEVMELRQSGVQWWAIVQLFDVSESTLVKYTRQAELYGFDYWRGYKDG